MINRASISSNLTRLVVVVLILGSFGFINIKTPVTVHAMHDSFCPVFPEVAWANITVNATNETTSGTASGWNDSANSGTQDVYLEASIGDRIRFDISAYGVPNPDSEGPVSANTGGSGVFIENGNYYYTSANANFSVTIDPIVGLGTTEFIYNPCDRAAWVYVHLTGPTPTPTPTTTTSPTPTPLPRIGLTKIQSTIAYPVNSDTFGVMNVGSSGPSGMDWTGSTPNTWITPLNAGAAGGTGLLSGQTSMGSYGIDVTQAYIGINNGSILETCSNCEAGYDTATLGVEYTVPGPTINISANPAGPVTPGTPVTLTWTGTNCNAANPVSSSNFGAGTCSGSTIVTPVSPSSTYTITIKGLSNVDASANNFANASVNVAVVIAGNQAPSSSNVGVGTNYCFTSPNTAVITWIYSDPDDIPVGTDPQSAFQVQVDLEGSSFNPPSFDSGKILGNQTSYTATSLPLGRTLKARVRVWDSQDLVSAWSVSGSWNSANTAYPATDFCWPENCNAPIPGPRPKANTPVPFTDLTVFNDGTKSNHDWDWTFGDGGTSTLQDPIHTYLSSNTSFTVTLTATDRYNQSCTVSKLINVQRSIPIWKEISPGQ